MPEPATGSLPLGLKPKQVAVAVAGGLIVGFFLLRKPGGPATAGDSDGARDAAQAAAGAGGAPAADNAQTPQQGGEMAPQPLPDTSTGEPVAVVNATPNDLVATYTDPGAFSSQSYVTETQASTLGPSPSSLEDYLIQQQVAAGQLLIGAQSPTLPASGGGSFPSPGTAREIAGLPHVGGPRLET